MNPPRSGSVAVNIEEKRAHPFWSTKESKGVTVGAVMGYNTPAVNIEIVSKDRCRDWFIAK